MITVGVLALIGAVTVLVALDCLRELREANDDTDRPDGDTP